MVGLFWSV